MWAFLLSSQGEVGAAGGMRWARLANFSTRAWVADLGLAHFYGEGWIRSQELILTAFSVEIAHRPRISGLGRAIPLAV
jgi:hypothetical protein